MFGKILEDLTETVEAIATIAVAPVVVVAAAAKEITQPIAEAAKEAVEELTGNK